MAKRTTAKKAPAAKKAAARQPQKGASANPFDVSSSFQREEYILPFLLFLVVIPVISAIIRSLLYAYTSTLVTWLVAIGISAAGAGLTYVVWDEAFPRQKWTKFRAAVSVAYIHAVIAMTVLWDGWRPIFLQTGIGLELAIWWAVAALPAVRGDGRDAHGHQQDTLADALSLGKTRATKVEDDPSGRTVHLKMVDATKESLVSSIGLIAVKAGISANLIEIMQPNPDDDSRQVLRLPFQDPLRKMGPWPGPSRPGASIKEPVRFGMRTNSTVVEAVKVGTHTITGGVTGSGKTETTLTEHADVITRYDVIQFWADTGKPHQTLPDIAPSLARIATKKAQVHKLVAGLLAAIDYRSGILGGREWTSSDRRKIPAVGCRFEEGADVAAMLDDQLDEFTRKARSVGIFIDLSMQRPSGGKLDTDTRMNFTAHVCHGMQRDEDVAMVLPDDMLDMGVRPTFGKKKPGSFYASVGPEEFHTLRCRAWLPIPPTVMRAHVAEWAPRMSWGRGPEALDEGTAQAMGSAWTDLQSGPDYALKHGWTRDTNGHLVPPAGIDLDDEDDDTTPTPQASTSPAPATAPAAPSHPQPWREIGPRVPTPRPAHPSTGADTSPGTTTSTSHVPAGTDEDDDESTEEITINRISREIQDEVDAIEPPDPEIADAIRAAAATDDDPADIPLEGELWTGPPGPELDRPGRVIALADVIAKLLADDSPEAGQRQPDGGKVMTTERLVDGLMEIPGWTTSQRPAMYRMFDRMILGGEAEDRGRGVWWVADSAPSWLRRELATVAESDDVEDLVSDPA